MIRTLFHLTITLFMLASCVQKQEAMLSDTEGCRADSLALHVAVMPAMGCLPVYYACMTGLADSAGLDMRLVRYNSQMDIDTAMANGRAEAAYLDLVRAVRLNGRVSPFLSVDEEISMITPNSTRAKTLKDMKDRMVAVSRLSMTDLWCDRMLDSASMGQDDVFRPQINNVILRAGMMSTGLLEGAMMGEPYSTWMAMEGNKRLFRSKRQPPRLGAWVLADTVRTDSFRTAQIKTFISILETATAKLNNGEQADSVRKILIREYGIPPLVADSIKLARLAMPSQVSEDDLSAACQWLTGRKAMPKDFKKDSFITNIR